jgi:transposase
MLSWEEDVQVHALRGQGWTISAIARHLGRDRKTVRAYLRGERTPGVRARRAPDPFEPFAAYCRLRLEGDPHLWATTLYDEVGELGYPGSYPSFTRALRARRLRPHCEPCQASKGRAHAVIEHPPGLETQWDWLELPDPPAGWGWGGKAHLLVGALAGSGRWRGVLLEATDLAHLVDGLDRVARRLGGLTRRWRFDRMATVCSPATGRLQASFAGVAKHYGVEVDLCPARHGNRKGVVEKANHAAAQRWWRTLGDQVSTAEAQASLDRLCVRLDDRRRTRDGARTTVGELAAAEPLRPVPPQPYPATLQVTRRVSAQALVGFRGNSYSVPPELAGATVTVWVRLGARALELRTAAGTIIARHRRATDGAGVLVRDATHVVALERAVLARFSDRPPCRRKTRRPPSAAALAEAARLRGQATAATAATHVVVDLAAYADAAARLERRPVAAAVSLEPDQEPTP